jgi:hypothetical protein
MFHRLCVPCSMMRRNLHARLEQLEQLVRAAGKCRCMTVVWDGEVAPPHCPHGRPWCVVVQVVYEDAPANEAVTAGDCPPTAPRMVWP